MIGVGSSVGRASAMTFGSQGARVLAIDSLDRVAADVAAAIDERYPGRAVPVVADLVSEAGARSVADRVQQLWSAGLSRKLKSGGGR